MLDAQLSIGQLIVVEAEPPAFPEITPQTVEVSTQVPISQSGLELLAEVEAAAVQTEHVEQKSQDLRQGRGNVSGDATEAAMVDDVERLHFAVLIPLQRALFDVGLGARRSVQNVVLGNREGQRDVLHVVSRP